MKRKVVVVFLAILVVLGTMAFAFQRKAAAAGGEWVEARNDDLVLGVEVSGELAAVDSDSLGPPGVERIWDYKISMMAPEGSDVQKGMPVLAFDTTELARALEERLAERDSATKEIEKKRADLQVQTKDEELGLAKAEATFRKADLKLQAPVDVMQQNERRETELERSTAVLEVRHRRNSLVAMRRAASEEIALLEGKLQSASQQVGELQRALASMTVRAPRNGTVIYVGNHRSEKKKIGDSAWRGEKIIEIPDLSRMKAKGEIDESDAGRVAAGQRMTFRLDAHPDDEWRGAIRSIARSVQRQSPTNPLKVLSVDIALDRTDSNKMRPGMRFRGTVETGRIKNALIVPLDAVFMAPGGPTVCRRSFLSVGEILVRLGHRNEDQIQILKGLDPGDEVLHRPEERGEESD